MQNRHHDQERTEHVVDPRQRDVLHRAVQRARALPLHGNGPEQEACKQRD
jgi:hypothetical protein